MIAIDGFDGYFVTSDGRVFSTRATGEAFVGPRPTPLHVARHLDGCPTNNDVSNLAWGTQSQNMQDMLEHGRHGAWLHPTRYRRGESHVRAKLTESDVRNLRTTLALGVGVVAIAKQYGVSRETIARAIRSESWRHIEPSSASGETVYGRSTKLSSAKAAEVLRRAQSGESVREIAREFGVSEYTVYDIRSGRTWKSLNRSEA